MNSSVTRAVSANPTTGRVVSSPSWANEREVDAAIALVVAGYRRWRQTPLAERVDTLRRIGAALRARGEEVAQMVTLETGKSIAQARGGVVKPASLCDWYTEHDPAILTTGAMQMENNQAVTEYCLLGAILAVMPRNFPVWQVLRGAVPILLAGNSYLLEHAPNMMGSARLLDEISAAVDLPDGMFGWVNIIDDGVPQITNDDRVATVTVTGSVRAGKAIGAQAGAALRKCVLESGGSDPFIVLNGADLDEAVKAVVTSHHQNSGQMCVAPKRFILEVGIADAFIRKFVDVIAASEMGDPRDEQSCVGPMACSDLRDELHQQVTATLDEEATLLLGMERIEGMGNYYAPIALGNATARMVGPRQELFGPVATLTTTRDVDHALALASDGGFGLSVVVYTTNEAQAQRFVRELECGGIFLNGYCTSDVRTAFGSVKKSGFGRELSHFGPHEFYNTQVIQKNRRQSTSTPDNRCPRLLYSSTRF